MQITSEHKTADDSQVQANDVMFPTFCEEIFLAARSWDMTAVFLGKGTGFLRNQWLASTLCQWRVNR